MSEENGVDSKKGRGRPKKPESEKKETKRPAPTEFDKDGNPIKRGRGRPKGSVTGSGKPMKVQRQGTRVSNRNRGCLPKVSE